LAVTDVSGQPAIPSSMALLGLLDPWRWNPLILPKRRQLTSQKSEDLIFYPVTCYSLWGLDNSDSEWTNRL